MEESPHLKRILDDSHDDERAMVEGLGVTSGASRISQGNLSQRPFGALLAELHRWRSEGALFLRRGDVKKVVYFRIGRAVMVRSNLVSECLGRVLIRERFISENDCEESLRRLKKTGRPQGAILIEMGSISPHNLVYALQLQLQTKLLEIFRWPDGSYQFDSRTKVPGEPVTLELTTAAAIYEGIKRAYTEDRVAKELGNVNKLYPAPSPDPLYRFQEIGLDSDEARLLATIDGSRTVAEIAIGGQLPAPATLRFLLAMRTAQVLEFHDEATHEPLPADVRAALAPEPVRAPPPNLARTKSTVRPPPRVSPEQLRAKVIAMRQQNHFEVLGAAFGTPPEALKPMYLALARDYHPDKHFSASSDGTRELAAEIFSRITLAYEVLSDPDERQRYLDELARPQAPKPKADPISNILAAENKFEHGKDLLAEGRISEAVTSFREAVRMYGNEGEFHAWLGWAVFSEKPADPAAQTEALTELEEAIQMSSGLEQAYLFLGRVHLAQGRVDRAEREFERALKSNPDSAEALKELRQLGFR